MARPSLSDEHRLEAMFALAEDYFRAGLFDRAERLVSSAGRERGAARAGAALPAAHLRAAARLGAGDRSSQRADRARFARAADRDRALSLRAGGAGARARRYRCSSRAPASRARRATKFSARRADSRGHRARHERAGACGAVVPACRGAASAVARACIAARVASGARQRRGRSGAALQRLDSSRAVRARRARLRGDRRRPGAGAVRARLPAGSAARRSEPRRNRAFASPAIRGSSRRSSARISRWASRASCAARSATVASIAVLRAHRTSGNAPAAAAGTHSRRSRCSTSRRACREGDVSPRLEPLFPLNALPRRRILCRRTR